MIYKFIGSVLIITASVFLLSQKTLGLYYTYVFLNTVADTICKLIYESSSNLTYKLLFVKLGFNIDEFISESMCNRYIKLNEIEYAKIFFNNLGKRDKESEIKYLEYNLTNFEKQKNIYYKKYKETQKVNLLYGITCGIFISIILV